MVERALLYVEVDILYCSLIYGEAPCTASLTASPPTGTIKCFNGRQSCQDIENFAGEDVTLRFAMPADYLPDAIEAIPSIISVDTTPAIVSLGENLGQRASISVKFKDHRWSDTGPGFDKYVSERPYNPYEQGTFWGKFRARQPFLRGRSLRLIRGIVGQSLGEMETRHYVIESFDGPTPDGEYTLVAKDILKLADGDRAKAPLLSNGFLTADISDVDTSATLSPAGVGDEEYPASGYVAIGGKEIVAFTRSGDVLTFETAGSPSENGRAQLGTEAQEHSAQDRVQLCIRYSGQDPADIIADLFENYAGIDSSYIPITTWRDETENFLGRLYTATIAEPTSVNDLVSEIIEQAALAVWWSDTDQEIKLQVLRAISTDVDRFTETDNILKGSLQTKEQPDKRISRVWTYFAQRNPLEPQDDADNYRSSAETVDSDAETDYGTPAIKEIFSRWIPVGGRTTATRLNDILLGRFRDPPRNFRFDVLRSSQNGIVPIRGAGYRIEAWPLQDVTGAATDAPIQVTKIKPDPAIFEIEAEEMRFVQFDEDQTDNRVIIFDASVNNVNLRTVHDTLFPAPTEGDVTSPPTVTVTALVNAGVVVGSTSTANPAFDVGTWPSGFPLALVVNGRIQGMGGAGGTGATVNASIEEPDVLGKDGGTALLTAAAIDVEVSATGEIFGGGGGGGGGGGSVFVNNRVGGGGGGGAGTNGGAGGLHGGEGFGTPTSTDGDAGTSEAGGAGGLGGRVTGSGTVGGNGGVGGDPGQDGATGEQGGASFPGGAGGSAGASIDGISLVTLSNSGDIQGPQVN